MTKHLQPQRFWFHVWHRQVRIRFGSLVGWGILSRYSCPFSSAGSLKRNHDDMNERGWKTSNICLKTSFDTRKIKEIVLPFFCCRRSQHSECFATSSLKLPQVLQQINSDWNCFSKKEGYLFVYFAVSAAFWNKSIFIGSNKNQNRNLIEVWRPSGHVWQNFSVFLFGPKNLLPFFIAKVKFWL